MICSHCGKDTETGEERALNEIERISNGRLHVYTTCGQSIFPIYAESGGLRQEIIMYVVDALEVGAKKMKVLPIRLPYATGDPLEVATKAMQLAFEKFEELSHEVEDGHDMGLEGLDLRGMFSGS